MNGFLKSYTNFKIFVIYTCLFIIKVKKKIFKVFFIYLKTVLTFIFHNRLTQLISVWKCKKINTFTIFTANIQFTN